MDVLCVEYSKASKNVVLFNLLMLTVTIEELFMRLKNKMSLKQTQIQIANMTICQVS